MSHCVPGALGSKWGNPFKLKKANKNSLKQCLKRYEDHIRRNPDLFNAVMELEGKEIGCWCKPFPCHGDILIKLFKERQCTNSFSKSHQEFIPVLTQCGSNEDDVYSRNTESDLSASDSHDTVEGSNCYPSKGNLNQGRCVEECLLESFPSIFAPLRLRGGATTSPKCQGNIANMDHFIPKPTQSELHQLEKSFISTSDDSFNSHISVSDSSTTMLHSNLNPLALPFVSNLCNEDSQVHCDLRAIGTTPIFNGISTPDVSPCCEVLAGHSQGNHIFNNVSESEHVLGGEDVLNITPIVFDSETPNISMSEESETIGLSEPFLIGGSGVTEAAQTAEPVISINDTDDPKKLLQNLKAKNSERPIVAHININFLNPKFEPLKDIIKDNYDILLVSETKIDDTFPDGQFFIEGYKEPIRLDRNKNGGGLLFFIHDGLQGNYVT